MAKSTRRPQQRARSSSSRRSLTGSIASSVNTHVTQQEQEDTLQVMLDLLHHGRDGISGFGCASSSSSSEDNSVHTPTSSVGTPPKRLSPNSPTNYLQISHDGQVKTLMFASAAQSAFQKVSDSNNSGSPKSAGREPPGSYANNNSSNSGPLDVVLEYSAHSHSLREATTGVTTEQRSVSATGSETDLKDPSSSHSRLSLKSLRRKSKQVSFAATHDDSDSTRPPIKGPSCWNLTPHIFFLVGCSLYVAMAFLTVEFFAQHQGIVPVAILNANDDSIWWDYYNRTLGIPISQEDWFANNRPFLDDDAVATIVIDDEVVDVTRYQLVALAATYCFLVTGVLQVCLQKGKWLKVTYLIMVVAAGLGVAASLLVEYDGYWAKILYAASVHLFAVQAISLVVIHSSDDDDDKPKPTSNAKNKDASVATPSSETVRSSKDKVVWSVVGHVCFLIGTLIDVFVSYFRVQNSAGISHAYASVVAAAFWLVASILYLSIAAREHWAWNHRQDDDGSISSGESSENNDKLNTTTDTVYIQDEEDLTTKMLLKGKPLSNEMDADNSIISAGPAPFDETQHSLEL